MRKFLIQGGFWLAVSVFNQVFAQSTGKAQTVLAHLETQTQLFYNNPQIAPDGHGGIYILYGQSSTDSIAPRVLGRHITYNAVSGWPAAGLGVSSLPGTQTEIQALADGNGGVIVAWQQGAEAGRQAAIYLQCFNGEGAHLWSVAGVPAAINGRQQQHARLVSDYQGGAYVFWEEVVAGNEIDIVGQHIGASGHYLWPPVGVTICKAPGTQAKVQLASAPGQGVVALWEDFRGGDRWALYGQAMDADGTPKWAQDGLPVGEPHIAQQDASIVADGFGGMVCVYAGQSGLGHDRDLYVTRINRQGRQLYHKPFITAYGDQLHPRICKRGSDVWASWEDYRTDKAEAYLQKFDLARAESSFTPGGIAVSRQPGAQLAPKLTFSSLTGELCIGWADVYAEGFGLQKFSFSGMGLWPRPVYTLTDTPTGSLAFQAFVIEGDEHGGSWLLWQRSNQALMLNHISDHGLKLLGDSGFVLAAQPHTRYAGMDQLATAQGPAGENYLAWEDYRKGPLNPDIYLQRVGERGAVWAEGLPVCKASGNQGLPVLCAVKGGVYVGWVDRRNGQDDNLYLQFVDTAGHPRWASDGIPLCLAPRSQNSLRLAAIDSDAVLAVWTDARGFYETGFDLYLQKINRLGKSTFPQDGVALAALKGYQTSPVLATDGRQGAYIAWMDERQAGRYNIYIDHINAAAHTQWPGGPLQAAPSTANQRYPQVAVNDAGNLYVSWAAESAGSVRGQVYIQGVNQGGGFLWGPYGKTISPVSSGQSAPKIIPSGTETLVCWLDERNSSSSAFNLYAQRLSEKGEARWLSVGSNVGNNLSENAPYAVKTLAHAPLTYCLWQRSEGEHRQLSYAKLNADTGEMLWKAKLPPSEANQTNPQLLELLPGKMAACWIETNAAHTSAQLKLLWLE